MCRVNANVSPFQLAHDVGKRVSLGLIWFLLLPRTTAYDTIDDDIFHDEIVDDPTLQVSVKKYARCLLTNTQSPSLKSILFFSLLSTRSPRPGIEDR